MSLDDAFWNFARDVKRYTLNIIDLTEVNNSAKKLFTTYCIQRSSLWKLITHARSIHDKIFVNLLNCEKAPPLKITKYFDEFLKGITSANRYPTVSQNEATDLHTIRYTHARKWCGISIRTRSTWGGRKNLKRFIDYNNLIF